MSKVNFYRDAITIFLVAAAIGGAVFAFVLASDFQANGAMGPVSRSTGISWGAGATVLCLTVISLLRLTRVSWFWSIISGVLIIVLYSVFMTLLFNLLRELLRGWLFG
jgi:hypothetical protein